MPSRLPWVQKKGGSTGSPKGTREVESSVTCERDSKEAANCTLRRPEKREGVESIEGKTAGLIKQAKERGFTQRIAERRKSHCERVQKGADLPDSNKCR